MLSSDLLSSSEEEELLVECDWIDRNGCVFT